MAFELRRLKVLGN